MHAITDFLARLLAPDAANGLGIGSALAALGLAYFGGILSSLTPCVYPMIPITVSVIGGMGPARRSLREVIWRSLAYIGGMAMVYAILGVLAGLTGKVFGTFTNTPGWYLGLGIVLSLAALIMVELIPFDPLSWWRALKIKLGMKPAYGGSAPAAEVTLVGAFGLGASSGLVAAPCTTPALTTILAYIAKTQSIGMGMGLMLSFALGLGTLLMIIGAFAGAVQVLPRSGQWMKTLKVASGILLLAFADYLIYRAGTMGGLS